LGYATKNNGRIPGGPAVRSAVGDVNSMQFSNQAFSDWPTGIVLERSSSIKRATWSRQAHNLVAAAKPLDKERQSAVTTTEQPP
jgi:hypothetical protein